MRLCFVKILTVESLVKFVVFLIFKVVDEYQVVRSCFIEHRTANVSLAAPHATNDTIDVVDLQEAIHLEV